MLVVFLFVSCFVLFFLGGGSRAKLLGVRDGKKPQGAQAEFLRLGSGKLGMVFLWTSVSSRRLSFGAFCQGMLGL